jgi:hypothetical protein
MADYASYDSGGRLRDPSGRFTTVEKASMEASVFAENVAQFAAYSGLVLAAKIAKGHEVAEYWKGIAPHWGDRNPKRDHGPTGLRGGGGGVPNEPGDYAESIKVYEWEDGRVSVGTELQPLASFLEYGTAHNPEYACGAKTLAHFGGGSVDREMRNGTRVVKGTSGEVFVG